MGRQECHRSYVYDVSIYWCVYNISVYTYASNVHNNFWETHVTLINWAVVKGCQTTDYLFMT